MCVCPFALKVCCEPEGRCKKVASFGKCRQHSKNSDNNNHNLEVKLRYLSQLVIAKVS